MGKIDSFRNEYFFLSNFFEAPVCYEGITYKSNEAAFQAQKCQNKSDRVQFSSLTPSEAKRLGRSISLRHDWETVKVNIMEDLIYAKFSQNPVLREKLIKLQDVYLEEGNDWGDKIWGTVNGQGRNLLGQILMKVRDEFIKEKEEELDR